MNYVSRMGCAVARFPSMMVARRYSSKAREVFGVLEKCDLKAQKAFFLANPNAVNFPGGDNKTTPLHYFAGAGLYCFKIRLPVLQEPHEEFVQSLIDSRAYIEALNSDGESPLHIAAKVGYYGVARLLLREKASVNSDMLLSAMMRTVNFDPYFRLETALLAEGIDLSKEGPRLLASLISSIEYYLQQNENRKSPSYKEINRIEEQHFKFVGRKLKFLLENGANPDIPFEGSTALQAILKRLEPGSTGGLEDSNLRRSVEIVSQYCKDFTVCDENGWTYLHYAVHRDLPDLANLLLEKGLSLYQKDKQGLKPYDLAFLKCSSEMFSILGIDADASGITPKDVVEIMNKLPSDIKPKEEYWVIPDSPWGPTIGRRYSIGLFYLFSETTLEKDLEFLYNCDKGKTVQSEMMEALEDKNLERIKELISKGWNVHIENEHAAHENCRQSFYSTLQSVFKELEDDEAMKRSIITALVSATTSCITLGTEFLAALHHQDEKKAYLLIDMGLTADMVIKGKKETFDDLMNQWFNTHFEDKEFYRFEDVFYQPACRIIRRLIEKGLITNKDMFPPKSFSSSAREQFYTF